MSNLKDISCKKTGNIITKLHRSFNNTYIQLQVKKLKWRHILKANILTL